MFIPLNHIPLQQFCKKKHRVRVSKYNSMYIESESPFPKFSGLNLHVYIKDIKDIKIAHDSSENKIETAIVFQLQENSTMWKFETKEEMNEVAEQVAILLNL